eukprot:SM000199S05431  [mRNA]  locus=s199:175959:176464:- [translate_table: standard]
MFRQFEVDHNLPQMPIIGISANVKRADLEEYAKSGHLAILGKPVNERTVAHFLSFTVGKLLCNYLITYLLPSTGRRAQLVRGDFEEVKKSFDGFMAFV